MDNSKFKFIELPHPDFQISPDGAAHILGGNLCDIEYQHCIGNKNSFCALDPHTEQGYDANADCHGTPVGANNGLFCADYTETCKNYAKP